MMTSNSAQPFAMICSVLAQASLLCSEPVSSAFQISSVTNDSREVSPGTLFVCIRGAKFDGHEHLADAVNRGAVAAVVEEPFENTTRPLSIPILHVRDSRAALAVLADCFAGSPSRDLLMIGVTGTNGKTSTAWLIAQLLGKLGVPSAYGGTFGLAHPEQLIGAGTDHYAMLSRFQQSKTGSPDPLVLHRFLAELRASGAKAASLEATSQGIAQKRTRSVEWDAATFTNLTRDHLDLHGTMENYFSAKLELFTEELRKSQKKTRVAVVNIDDPWGQRIAEAMSAIPAIRLIRYSRISESAECFLRRADLNIGGSEIECRYQGQDILLRSRLIGAYNVENILAAISTVAGLGFPLSKLAEAMPEVPAVPGRIEIVSPPESDVSVVVDYAHTPDGLIQVQSSLRPLCLGRLITVFGCGGDRDRGKRPLMAKAVMDLSDAAVVTSDNPRTEVPERIAEDILPGFGSGNDYDFSVEIDRRKAIFAAVERARPGDTILVAGKGHEDYQEIHGTRHPFLDAQVCKEALALRLRRASGAA